MEKGFFGDFSKQTFVHSQVLFLRSLLLLLTLHKVDEIMVEEKIP